MKNNISIDFEINSQIKLLKKQIAHESKLAKKHINKSISLSRDLHSLLEQRKILLPHQYTKRGDLRKPYQGLF